MTAEAKERLARLALVKPEKAKQIEEIIIQNASSGRIVTKLDENQLIGYIEQVNQISQQNNTVTFKRKVCDSDDSLDLDGI